LEKGICTNKAPRGYKNITNEEAVSQSKLMNPKQNTLDRFLVKLQKGLNLLPISEESFQNKVIIFLILHFLICLEIIFI
jgi:uncharacterized lipoprotein YddW (UPF0748 family)